MAAMPPSKGSSGSSKANDSKVDGPKPASLGPAAAAASPAKPRLSEGDLSAQIKENDAKLKGGAEAIAKMQSELKAMAGGPNPQKPAASTPAVGGPKPQTPQVRPNVPRPDAPAPNQKSGVGPKGPIQITRITEGPGGKPLTQDVTKTYKGSADPKVQQGQPGFVKQQTAKLEAKNNPTAAASNPKTQNKKSAPAPEQQNQSVTMSIPPSGGKNNKEDNDLMKLIDMFIKLLLKILFGDPKNQKNNKNTVTQSPKPGDQPQTPGKPAQSITLTFKGPDAHKMAMQFCKMLTNHLQNNPQNNQTRKGPPTIQTSGLDQKQVDSLSKAVKAVADMLKPHKPQPGQGKNPKELEKKQLEQQQSPNAERKKKQSDLSTRQKPKPGGRNLDLS